MRFSQAHLLNLSRSLWMALKEWMCVDCITQLGVISKSEDGALNPAIHVTNKQHWSPYWPPRNTTHDWSTLGYGAIDHKILNANVQPTPYPPSGPSAKSMSLQFGDRDVVWDSIEYFTQLQVEGIRCSFFIHQYCNPVIEGHQIWQAWFALTEAMLAVTNHLLAYLSPSSTPQNIPVLVELWYWTSSSICFTRILPGGARSFKESHRRTHRRQKFGTSSVTSLCLEFFLRNDSPMRWESAGWYPPLPVNIQSYSSHFLSKPL